MMMQAFGLEVFPIGLRSRNGLRQGDVADSGADKKVAVSPRVNQRQKNSVFLYGLSAGSDCRLEPYLRT